MVDDKGITVQGEEPTGAQVAAAARLRNDLDRDGTADHLAGGYEDSRWESFREARTNEQEQLTADFIAARDGLQQVGNRLHSDLQRDPQFAGSPMETELHKSLEGDAPARNPAGMERAINSVALELDQQAERGDKAAQMWRNGALRGDLQQAHAHFEDTSEALQANRANLHRFDVASGSVRLAGAELHEAMQRDRQWDNTPAEAELRAALGNATRHPERVNEAVVAISTTLDRQAAEGLPAAQHWKESDLREQVVRATTDFQTASNKLALEARQHDSSVDAAAPAWEAQYDPEEMRELRDDAKAFNAGSRLDEIPASASQDMAYLQAYREGVTTREEQLLAEPPETVRSEQWERLREQLGKVDRSIEAAQIERDGADAAQQQPGRWTVQQYDSERGVYRDKLTSDDAQQAYAEFSKSPGYRVLDNKINDIAVDYEEVTAGPKNVALMQEAFHARSDFEQHLDAARAAGKPLDDKAIEDMVATANSSSWNEVRVSVDPEQLAQSMALERLPAAERERLEKEDVSGRPEDRAMSLQEILDRRSLLQQTVQDHSDRIAEAVDLTRKPGPGLAAATMEYELAARNYARAASDLAYFERQPGTNAAEVAKYREVQDAELKAEAASVAERHARIDGDKGAERKAIEDGDKAREKLAATWAREGVIPPVTVDSQRNTIERGLTPDQIDRLTNAGKGKRSQGDQEEEVSTGPRTPPPLPNVGEGHNQLRDQSAFNDAADKTRLVPEDVAARYKQDGQKYLDANDPKKVAFVDKGNRLQTIRTFDDKAVEDMVATADARGWTELRVSGDEAFRRKAYIEATARGIEVKGYEPTEQDKLRAEQLAKQTGRANAIEKNEVVDAYRAARDGTAQQKKEAAKQHPELANAFALEQAMRSFAKQRVAPESQEKLVESFRVQIEKDLAQGKKVPEIRLRAERERKQDRGVDR